MARRSLRPELNRIRAWVRQGRTDAWIAHQLEVTVQQIQAFKREQGLEPDGDAERGAARRLRRRDRPARRGRRADRRRARGGRGRARRGGRRGRRREPTRTRTPTRASAARRARRRGRRGGRGARTAQAEPARGDVRPRRGGLRPVARPRRPGRPDLRRVLGRPPAGRGRDRGGPDRDPPRRRATTSDDEDGELRPQSGVPPGSLRRQPLGVDPPPAGVVAGLAHVARERRAGDGASGPRPRGRSGATRDRDVEAPVGALLAYSARARRW